MNAYRTFLASLQFTDERFEPAAAKPVESDASDSNTVDSACDLERADEQQIAA